MGGGGQTTQASQQTQNVTQLPPWVNEAAQQNYALAQNVAARPLTQYQGQMVADVAPQQQQSWDYAANSGQVGKPMLDASMAGYLGSIGQTPATVTPQTLAGTNLKPYMDPYTDEVINKTLPLMQQQLALQQAGNANQASAANAFGGSRFGVQQGVTGAQGALGMGQMAAQLRSQGFQNAQQAATGDISRDLAAQQGNQAAQQAKIQSDIAASSGLSSLGDEAAKQQAARFTMLNTAGAQQQAQQQALINAQMGKFAQANNYPQQQMNTLLAALGMTPYGHADQGQSTTDTTTTVPASPAGIAMGGLQALGSLFGSGGIFSDRRLKTDITRVDTHPSGLPIYAYRYKGDPKSYPKVAGPMAEDVMKIAPHAVRPMGVKGRLAVDMNALPLAPNVPRGAPPMGSAPPFGSMPPGPGPLPGPLSAPGTMGRAGALAAGLMRSKNSPRMRPLRVKGALGG
jgi:hypothetical protein